MPNQLADAISPYLRSHADNPVDWHGWGAEAFAEARERDLPVLVSIGYSTCHWCHVMARESFSDPELAGYLNEHFVSIKVDREEHPEVDSAYLAAASAFVEGLGWPLNVFVTPEGRAFYAGTYFPPRPMPGHPSFREVLEAVTDAWTTRRAGVLERADSVAEALAMSASRQAHHGALGDAGAAGAVAPGAVPVAIPGAAVLDRVVAELVGFEDTVYGGFGGAPKFPVAPALGFLLDSLLGSPLAPPPGALPPGAPSPGSPLGRPWPPRGRSLEASPGAALALRTLKRLGASPLRDSVEGGFFRYAVNRDWSEPHYERMLYDNAQLLELYTQAWKLTGEQWARSVAEGVAEFLLTVLQLPSGGFASAQDSESSVDGIRVEGGYYALDEDARRQEPRPALDEKVLTGWNGLAITGLARAGFAFGSPDLIAGAARAADYLLGHHLRGDGSLVRASVDGRVSTARATLEDYGMLARGLLELAVASGEARYATAARVLLDATLPPATDIDPAASPPAQSPARSRAQSAVPFRVPTGPDPVLAGQGLALDVDPSEGAYPSGLTAVAGAARLLYLLTGADRYRTAAGSAVATLIDRALARPLAFGATLRLGRALGLPVEQLVVVAPDYAPDNTTPDNAPPNAQDARNGRPGDQSAAMLAAARSHATGLVVSVTETQARVFADAGFDLFLDRTARERRATAYLCRDFVCRLPVTDVGELTGLSAAGPASDPTSE